METEKSLRRLRKAKLDDVIKIRIKKNPWAVVKIEEDAYECVASEAIRFKLARRYQRSRNELKNFS
jgi:hypothetical protein